MFCLTDVIALQPISHAKIQLIQTGSRDQAGASISQLFVYSLSDYAMFLVYLYQAALCLHMDDARRAVNHAVVCMKNALNSSTTAGAIGGFLADRSI